MIKKLLAGSLGLLFIFAPATTLAVKTEFGDTNLQEYISKFYNYALVLGTALAIAVIIWAAVSLIMEGGNPEANKTAKDQIVYAILGLILLYVIRIILIYISGEPK